MSVVRYIASAQETSRQGQEHAADCTSAGGRIVMASLLSQWSKHLCKAVVATILVGLLFVPASAEVENSKIGFSPNHVFDGAIKGENIDIMNGNVNLQIPIGQRYQLNDWFGYQLQLYYNSKIWMNECDATGCPGYLVNPDTYGVGFSLHFGRIYHHQDDYAYIYRYQAPNGSERFFCDDSLDACWADNITLDQSSIRITRIPGGWEAYPGDGTRLVFGHELNSGIYDPNPETGTPHPEGGWYATSIETIAQDSGEPQQKVEIHYPESSHTDRIESITDSAGRTITFGAASIPNATKISLPAYAASQDFDPDVTADYILEWGDPEIFYDPSYDEVPETHNLRVLRKIHLPELTEAYLFGYGTGTFRLGYLKSWTVPTGATIDFHYNHYRTSENQPYHSQLAAKVLNPDPDTDTDYTWTYTRFGDGTPKTWEEAVAMTEGKTHSGSNPHKVKVLDPFGNLTVYRFHFTTYGPSSGQADCTLQVGCENKWWDGMMDSVKTYAGPEEDPGRLVRSESYEYMHDNRNVQFRYGGLTSTYNLIFPHVRPYQTTVVTHGGFDYPTTTHTTVHDGWTHLDVNGYSIPGEIPRAREVYEYKDGVLYRSTYTDYDPSNYFHDRHHFVEVRDATGTVLSRTDKKWDINRLECMLKWSTPTDTSVWYCSDDPTDGSVITRNDYDPATGSLQGKTVTGGDVLDAITTHYTYESGILAQKQYGDFTWKAVDRDIDLNTGLVRTSRDPSYVATNYTWDTLGRLREITPAGDEVPVVINYPTIRETSVTQTPTETEHNSGLTESTYLYDKLGRLIEERRRNLVTDHPYDFRRSEYDIAGRIVQQSEWAEKDTIDDDIAWTVYEYNSPYLNLDPGPDDPPYYADPLGRVSKVIRPDHATTTTEYEGLATRVTVSGIEGPSGPIDATTVYVNDAFGRLVEVDSPGEGADAVYLYDEHDRLREVQLVDPDPPAGGEPVQIRRFLYDTIGRLRSATNPENGTVAYLQYDARGKLRQYQDARGTILQNGYDDAGRLTTKVVLGGSAPRTLVQHLYDRSGAEGKLRQTKSYRSEDGSTATTIDYYYSPGGGGQDDCSVILESLNYGWQGLNKRLAYTETRIDPWNEPLKTEYCYNSLGLVSSVAHPSFNNARSVVRMSYTNGFLHAVDDVGHNKPYIKDVQYWPSGATKTVLRGTDLLDVIDRDEQGRPLEFRLESDSNDPDPGRPPLNVIWGCGDNQGGPIDADYCDEPPSTDVIMWDSGLYEYDLAGNITEMGLDAYRYDELNRLVYADVFSRNSPGLDFQMWYEYDAFGNMVDRLKHPSAGIDIRNDYSVDRSTNRLTSQLRNLYAISYAYDASGNMLSADDEGYLYDPLNRLTEVWYQGPGGGSLVAKYDYDTSGYRVRGATEESETFYVRDGSGRLLSEFRRSAGDADPVANPPAWNKDYIYALGQAVSLVKNVKPQTPGRPWATNVSPTQITVNWNPVEDPDLSHYLLERSVNDGDWELVSSHEFLSEIDTISDPGTGSETVFAYRVTAVDEAVNLSDPSPALVVRPFDPSLPNAPEITAGVSMDRAVSLSWTAVAADDLWGYTVERIGQWSFPGGTPGEPPEGMEWGPVADIPSPATSYFDFNLMNGWAYRYRVRAVDTAGHVSRWIAAEAEEGTDYVTLVPADIMPPAQPIGVTAAPDLTAGPASTRHVDGIRGYGP
jgi:YD repeat-containing protein